MIQGFSSSAPSLRWVDRLVLRFDAPAHCAKLARPITQARPMSDYIQSTLLPGEHVRLRASLSLWAHAGYLALGLVLAPLVVGLFILIPLFVQLKSTEMAVTNKRVLIKTGFISRQTLEMNLDSIEVIQVHQSIWGRLFNFGTIVITGAGNPQAPVDRIVHPIEFRREALLAQDEDRAARRPT
jgi:membrane protein YdbS with pleckstrin-like domain